LYSYISNNKTLILIQILMHIATWTYSSITMLMLSKYYSYTDSELSIIQNSFIIGIILSSAFQNINLNKRVKYNHVLLYSMFILPIILLLKFTWTELDLNHFGFSILHFGEGIGYGLISVIVGHFIKNILLNNKKNGHIYSYIVSSTYIIKTVVPLVISYFFIFEGHENYIFLYGFIIFFVNFLIIYKKRRNIFDKYQRLITRQKKSGNIKNNITFKESLNNIYYFLRDEKDRRFKIHYIYAVASHNLLRPYYDLYSGLLLINYYSFSLTKTVAITSFMVLGQASQFIIGSLSDKIKIYLLGSIGMILKILMFGIFFYIPDLFSYGIMPYIIFYLLGFSRTFYAAYDYKLNNNLIKKGYTVNDIGFIQMFSGEVFHYISYAFFAILLIFGFNIHDLTYITIFIAFFILISMFTFDRNNFNINNKDK